ncbi:permease family-domain-containing protein [Butyriboletus roseoflavus]|nr:permease family-domain-containing protein [Butyriboletus roseoflavus]
MSSESAITKHQPAAIEPPHPTRSRFDIRHHARIVQRKLTTRKGWFGDYDYAWLCSPVLPFSIGPKKLNPRRQPPFYGIDDELPLVLAMTSGLQHALTMLAGLITPPIVFASTLALDAQMSAYMISASLIGCGILSLVQMSRIKLWKGYYLGTGLLSVVGTSFATLSTADAIFNALYANGTCPSVTAADGTVTRGACPDAYGMVLGTSLICSFLEMGLSFIPPRTLQRIFPPMVTGTVIVMIGASLIDGAHQSSSDSAFFRLSPIIITELFGSPFLKNASIIVGLVVGCIVAGAAGYIDGSTVTSAPAITFLWVHTFKIGVYPPAILPMLAVYVSTTMEAIGDITASAEVSRLKVTGDDFDSRIQGGVLSDGLGGFISALFTVTPLSIFAQNNGVIALTRCANRAAGRWCCAFLILFGVLGKVSAFFLAIPNSVLGGVTTFLFASVVVSGLRVLSYMEYTRRDRFILAAAMSFGIGDLLMPNVFTYLFDGVPNPNLGLQGLFDSITIVLSTPFLVSGLVAVVLNLIIPREAKEDEGVEVEQVDQAPEASDQAQKA